MIKTLYTFLKLTSKLIFHSLCITCSYKPSSEEEGYHPRCICMHSSILGPRIVHTQDCATILNFCVMHKNAKMVNVLLWFDGCPVWWLECTVHYTYHLRNLQILFLHLYLAMSLKQHWSLADMVHGQPRTKIWKTKKQKQKQMTKLCKIPLKLQRKELFIM